MSEDPYGTIPMFETPSKYRRPKREQKGDRWRRHSGPRMTCEICMIDIRDGKLLAPLATATKILSRKDRDWHLCHQHAMRVKSGERTIP